jgi:hypothetical protein
MAKDAKNTPVARLNIYVPDPAIRRQVKTAAAKRDLSVSEYCLRAITRQLIGDGEKPPQENVLHPAVETARRFQKETFGGRAFTVSSADLIQEAREEQSGR